LRKIGAGVLRLTGTQANTYTTDTLIDEGTLFLAKSAGVSAVQGNVVVGDGLGGNNVDQLILANSEQIVNSGAVTVNESGLFNLNNFNETVGGLTLQGGEVLTGTGLLTLAGGLTTNASAEVSKITGKLSLGASNRVFNIADN